VRITRARAIAPIEAAVGEDRLEVAVDTAVAVVGAVAIAIDLANPKQPIAHNHPTYSENSC
jgi:hypothetical protein